ncbi:hypothetical protein M8494_21725 [Serratia ureilytica]
MLANVKRSFAAAIVLMLALPAFRPRITVRASNTPRLDKPAAARAPAVVEFFSFCGPCYQPAGNLAA